jgi:UDP-glucose 4-epimerase
MNRSLSFPKRVAVTGGAGFIGTHTVEVLVERGCQVLVIDDLSHACGEPLPPGVEFAEADAGTEDAARALGRFRPDAVLHLASKGGVERARRDPGAHVQASLAATVALYHAAVAAGAGRIVSASSGGTVYGNPARLPTHERVAPAPVSAYGAAKLSEEVYLAMLRRLHPISAISLRYGNVFGPRQDGTGEAGLVAITATRLAGGQPPRIFGEGLQSRDFIYVRDVAAANAAALASVRSGPINVATGRETTVRDIVGTLRQVSGEAIEPEFAPARGSEVRRVCLDPSRAFTWLGWKPEVSLEQGLQSTYEYFQDRSLQRSGKSPDVTKEKVVSACE